MALSRKKKIIIAVSAVVVLLLIVIISVIASRKDEPEVTTVKVDIRPELRSTVTASGEVRPVRYIKLTSEIAGRILEIYVNPGDQVNKGQSLVRIDPTQLQSSQEAQFAATQASINDVQNARNGVASAQQSLVVAEAAVSQARQQTVSAEIDLKTAERELKRATNLVESNVMSRSEYDAARDRYDQAKAKLEAQNIAVKEAIERANQQRVAVKEAQTSVKSSENRANQQQAILRGQTSQREKATQYSPLTGVVADIPTRVGEFAVSQLSSTPLMTIADMSTINVEVNVDETEIANVDVGQPVKVKVDALGEKEINATVTQKNPLAIAKSDTTGGLSNRVNVQEAKEFKVTIELKDLAEEVRAKLRPGMSATATITTKTKTNVIAVPLQAIVEKAPPAPSPGPSIASSAPTPQGEKVKEQKGVYILDKTNKVKFVEVVTGITGESDIEVTSGLQAGAEVVTGPSRVLKTLKDGTSVKRQTRASAANANAGGN
ncbi:MAG TPA: efflux RND transporter periplasmic adaptor subunit [Pyrinomonadaceae bacterium]|jgi:HlyD family secretion protein|nr:efflux RND transporter periplasmic adaptor subunit [Pyrinomonadaceae bacterium]